MMEFDGVVQVLERLGSFGLLAFLVFYFVRFSLPKQNASFLEALQHQREDFERILVMNRQELKAWIESLAARQKKTSENLGLLVEKAEAGVLALRANGAALHDIKADQRKHFEVEEPLLKKLAENKPKSA